MEDQKKLVVDKDKLKHILGKMSLREAAVLLDLAISQEYSDLSTPVKPVDFLKAYENAQITKNYGHFLTMICVTLGLSMETIAEQMKNLGYDPYSKEQESSEIVECV